MEIEKCINSLYENFNQRNIDGVLNLLHDDVQWANGWKGGFVIGHKGIRDYWTTQWSEINPYVYPISINDKRNQSVEVLVHQVVHDKSGGLMFDGNIKHHFFFESGLISKFEIENIDKEAN